MRPRRGTTRVIYGLVQLAYTQIVQSMHSKQALDVSIVIGNGRESIFYLKQNYIRHPLNNAKGDEKMLLDCSKIVKIRQCLIIIIIIVSRTCFLFIRSPSE